MQIDTTSTQHAWTPGTLSACVHAAHPTLYVTLQHACVLTLTLLQTAVGSKHPTCAERMTLKGPLVDCDKMSARLQ